MSLLQASTGLLLRMMLSLVLFHQTGESGSGALLTRIVHTRFGRLQGVVRPMNPDKNLKPVEAFLGVPYATPPVSSNR